MTAHADPDTLIGLGEVAGILNYWFGLADDERISYNTPMVWWNRSQKNRDIALPMPEPEIQLGQRRSPAWKQRQIIDWYGEWQNRAVPARAKGRRPGG